MNAIKPKTLKKPLRFSLFTQVCVGFFFIALSVSPVAIFLLLRRGQPIADVDWILPIVGVGVIQALFWYADKRCSSENLSYWNGLLFVAAFMSTGWIYMSMLLIFPALLVAFLASVGLALYYDLTFTPGKAAFKFHRLVHTFHQHRMRQ